MISVLLADDHSIVRTGLKHIINDQTDMKVVSEAEDGEGAVRKALELQPDVVIMDLKMPKKSGLIATKQINESNSNIKIIILTMYDEKEYIFRVLQAGASGFLLKSHSKKDLINSIRTVHRGEAYLYPNATRLLLNDYIEKSKNSKGSTQELTGREQEVLSYLAKGYTNREVSEKLYLSIKTIESHRSNIMRKLNLHTRHELVKYAIENGFLDLISTP